MKAKRRKKRPLYLYVLVGMMLTLFSACSKHQSTPTFNDTPTTDETTPTLAQTQRPVDVIANFVFAGWMGDGEFGEQAITLNDRWTEGAHSPPACVKVTYRPMSKGWAGIYAQYNVQGPGNWGDRPGRDLTGYTKLVFWAKGETGNEEVEFKAGGIDAPGKQYRDSFEVSLGTVQLDTNWTRYELDLSNEDLSSVIGGFCWVATKNSNPSGLTFYVDTITYE
jgi:hypothetical protein